MPSVVSPTRSAPPRRGHTNADESVHAYSNTARRPTSRCKRACRSGKKGRARCRKDRRRRTRRTAPVRTARSAEERVADVEDVRVKAGIRLPGIGIRDVLEVVAQRDRLVVGQEELRTEPEVPRVVELGSGRR